MVCCTYFMIKKQFDATILDFQFELVYLAAILATVLALFQEIAKNFQSSGTVFTTLHFLRNLRISPTS
jgi:hypothetical protein